MFKLVSKKVIPVTSSLELRIDDAFSKMNMNTVFAE